MDGNGSMNLRNLGPFAVKGNLGLELMSGMAEKPLFGNTRGQHHFHHQQPQLSHHTAFMASMNGPFYHHRVGGFQEPPMQMDYRDPWVVSERDKYLNMLPANNNHHHLLPSYGILSETSNAQPLQVVQQTDLLKNEIIPGEAEASCLEGEVVRKRGAGKPQRSPKTKKVKRAPKPSKSECTPSVKRSRAPKKGAEVVINGITMDISGIPIPICSCTGTPHQCYRWGSGGWQSACCTTSLSKYPLPQSTKRRGARIAGRKMSLGAFKKVLEKLASEGYNFSNPIDLKLHWAKHGTNKFVTIR